MIIEREVLGMIDKYLNEGDKAYFKYNTLWVQASEDVARKIWHFLYDAYDGDLYINKIATPRGDEYAYDFI